MFAGIDIASERHVLARIDSAGRAIGRPIAFGEDHAGHTRLAEALGPSPVLVAMKATGHCRKNLFAVLTAAGHDLAPLNPFTARRFQDASLERAKTGAIGAEGLAHLAFEKRPAPTPLHDGRHRSATGPSDDGDAGNLRELVRHRDRLRQDFDDGVRRRLTEIDRDIEGLIVTLEVGRLLLSIGGLGSYTVARIIAAAGDPAHFRSAGAFAADVGVIPDLRQSGRQSARIRAPITAMGNARLRKALWMPVPGAVRRNPWLRSFYERLRAAGKPARLALIGAMRKLLNAVCSVARNRKPFVAMSA